MLSADEENEPLDPQVATGPAIEEMEKTDEPKDVEGAGIESSPAHPPALPLAPAQPKLTKPHKSKKRANISPL